MTIQSASIYIGVEAIRIPGDSSSEMDTVCVLLLKQVLLVCPRRIVTVQPDTSKRVSNGDSVSL